jgi:hypothetical protein
LVIGNQFCPGRSRENRFGVAHADDASMIPFTETGNENWGSGLFRRAARHYMLPREIETPASEASVKRTVMTIAVALSLAPLAPAVAQQPQRVPFTQSLSNTTPLTFGMTAAEAAAALGVPLDYVSGAPGNEMLAAKRPSPVYNRREAHLFLQFRSGRLTGWKGDWSRNWMWE